MTLNQIYQPKSRFQIHPLTLLISEKPYLLACMSLHRYFLVVFSIVRSKGWLDLRIFTLKLATIHVSRGNETTLVNSKITFDDFLRRKSCVSIQNCVIFPILRKLRLSSFQQNIILTCLFALILSKRMLYNLGWFLNTSWLFSYRWVKEKNYLRGYPKIM